jgi:tripartite-type tricarboxylate transporter receptor subunit TctC
MPRLLASLLIILFSATATHAQSWPDKPVRLVVPFPAGGGTDIVARVLAERLGDSLGQRFIVENKPGASGMIGANAVAKAAPDGYTLLVSSTTEVAIVGSIYPQMAYDPQKDLAPISLLAITPLVIVAHPSAGIATPQQLLAALQARPGKLSYSTPGIASPQHLVGEYIKMVAAVDMQHVPYTGVAPAVRDVVSGHLPLTITGLPPVVSHLKAGTVKAVAVTTGKRTSLLPDVPAFAELGETYKDIDVSIWFGFLAPAGISQDIIAKLHATTMKALGDPIVRDRLAQLGAEPVGNAPAEFQAFIGAEIERYARMAKATSVKAEP